MRHSALAALAVLAVVLFVVAACGTARQPARAPVPPAAPVAAGVPPASGSLALARHESAKLLHGLVLPGGARHGRPATLPAALRSPPGVLASGHLVQRQEFFRVSRPAAAVLRYVRGHVPSWLAWAGSGQTGGPAGPREVTWSPRHIPAGLYQAELTVSVLPAGGRALVRADTQVIWYPPRSRAEYIQPARFAAVRLAGTVYNPRQRTFRKVITAPAVIARLARTLNVLPADPGLTYSCPAIVASFRVTFVPAVATGSAVVAVPDGCNAVTMTAGGQPQPGLTGGDATIVLIGRLLGIAVGHPQAARH